jgi:acetoin utilization protein AcuB
MEEQEAGTSPFDMQVTNIMSSDVISVISESDTSDLIDLMLEHRLGAIPVVDEERLVGVVSYVDLLREARDLL